MATSSIQEIIRTFHSRKLLLYPSFNQSSASTLTSVAPTLGTHDLREPTGGENSFDADVLMVLTVLLCALICSIGLDAIVRCALNCLSLVPSDDDSRNGELANSGINKKALKTFPVVSYTTEVKIPDMESECVICLMEYSPGEKIRVLPKCNHGFHVKCIDKWLDCHSSCPTCRHCLIETCNKILGVGDSSARQSLRPPQEILINISPLEPEGMVRSCQS